MITPTYHGRKMKLIKEYPNHALFQDEKTGIRMSFTYYELGINTKQLEESELKQYVRRRRDLRTAV